jgi:hypothetical protein
MYTLLNDVQVGSAGDTLDALEGYMGQKARKDTGETYIRTLSGWVQVTDADGAGIAMPVSGSVQVQNSSGTISRTVTATAGVAKLAASDTIVGSGDTIVVQNSAGGNAHSGTPTITNGSLVSAKLPATTAMIDNGATQAILNFAGGSSHNASVVVASGVVSSMKLPTTTTFLDDAATLSIQNSAGADGHNATCAVSNGALVSAKFASTVAMVDNGDSIVLHNSSGTTSSGNSGLNSPAVAEVANGVITDVKAAA